MTTPNVAFVVLSHTTWIDPFVGIYLTGSSALDRHGRIEQATIAGPFDYETARKVARSTARQLGMIGEDYTIMDAAILAPKMLPARVVAPARTGGSHSCCDHSEDYCCA